MSDFFNKLMCLHKNLVGEPDEYGHQICADCLSVVTVVLTRKGLERAFQSLLDRP